MEDSFHVPFVRASERASAGQAAIVFTLGGLGAAFFVPWALLGYIPLALGFVWTYWRTRRLSGRGMVFDSQGVGPAEDGIRLWTLPWSRYGGARRTRPSFWESIRRPERAGFEVFDADGQTAFEFVLPAKGNSARAAQVEFRLHLPPGAPDPFASKAHEPRIEFVVLLALIGLVGLTFTPLLLRDPQAPAFALGGLGRAVAVGALAAATIEGARLVRWQRGWRPKSESLPSAPEEGPRLESHVARHASAPIQMVEGARYRVVEPERTRQEIRYTGRLLRGMSFFYGVISLVFVIIVALKPPHDPIGLALVLSMGGFALVCGRASVGVRQREDHVDDVFWVHDGHLVVIRPQGEPLVLALPTANDRAALRRKALFGATDRWRLPDGTHCAIDRTRLYPADLPAELDCAEND